MRVVVAPAGHARTHRRAERRGRPFGELAGERPAVDVGDEVAESLGHVGGGDRTEVCRHRLEPGGQFGLAVKCRGELGLILLALICEPVEPVGLPGRYPGHGRSRPASLGKQRRPGKRMRAPAGPAESGETVNAEVPEDRADVAGGVRVGASGIGVRARVARSGHHPLEPAARRRHLLDARIAHRGSMARPGRGCQVSLAAVGPGAGGVAPDRWLRSTHLNPAREWSQVGDDNAGRTRRSADPGAPTAARDQRHLYEAEMKEDRRTHGDPAHTSTPPVDDQIR